MEKIRRLIELHEGRVASVYQDSLGFWTIGVGHLVDRRKGGGLPPAIIDALLEHDVESARAALQDALTWFAYLDEVRQAALVDMAFNLGVRGLLGFKKTLALVRDRDYLAASVEMLDSTWARQVGSRARRLSRMMESGRWPTEIAA